MRKIAVTNKYKKDLELAKRRHLPMDELNDVIYNLANDILLPKDKKDHALKGIYTGFRECHITPDWLLVYKKIDDKELPDFDSGTHRYPFRPVQEIMTPIPLFESRFPLLRLCDKNLSIGCGNVYKFDVFPQLFGLLGYLRNQRL